jgi:hypothetical protein
LTISKDHAAYASNGGPLILFSEVDGTGLASLHFRPSSRKNTKVTPTIRSFIAPNPIKETDDKQRFQGLINADKQEFELVITNLSNEAFINFNLMKTNEKVTEIDPQGSLNQINELRPMESYTVQCDQLNNLPLILKQHADSITVGQINEQQKDNNKSKGTYLFLNIAPLASCKDLVERYKKTIWKTSELFVVKESSPIYSMYAEEEDEETDAETVFNNAEEPSTFTNREVCVESLIERSECITPSSLQLKQVKGIAKTVLDSKVGEITYGKGAINVYSQTTGLVYDYETMSRPCVLGLSINEKLEFIDNVDYSYLKKQAEEYLEMVVLSKYEDFLKTDFYVSDECVICMESSNNCVLYTCGHMCGHYDCLMVEKCPLCRTRIIAKLKC